MNNRLKILLGLVTLTLLASCAKNDTPESVTLRLGVGGVGGQVWGEKEQTVLYGESSKPVSEVADKGFVFDGWYSNGVKTSDAPVLVVDEMQENTEVTARFRQEHTDIPLIVIDTENGSAVSSREDYIFCGVTVSDPNNDENCGNYTAQIRGRGNASWNFQKKGYKIKFSSKTNLLGIGSEKNKDWVLVSCHGDQSMLRNYITSRMGQLLDGIEYSPSCSYAEVIMNGSYLGVYLVSEQVEEKSGRIISSQDNENYDANSYLIELDMYAAGEPFVDYIAVGSQPYSIKSEVTKEEGEYLLDFMKKADAAVKSGNKSEVEKYICLPSLVDTFIIQEFSKNIDVGWSSLYILKEADGLLHYTAPWDFDLAFGNDYRLDNGSAEKLYAAYGRDGFEQNNGWFIKLWSYSWFREEIARRWFEIGDILDTVYDETKAFGEKLEEPMERNYEKWNSLKSRTHMQPDSILRLNSYSEHVEYLLEWYNERREYLDKTYEHYIK